LPDGLFDGVDCVHALAGKLHKREKRKGEIAMNDKKDRAGKASEQALGPDDKNDFTGMPDKQSPDFEPDQSAEGQVEQAEHSTKRDRVAE